MSLGSYFTFCLSKLHTFQMLEEITTMIENPTSFESYFIKLGQIHYQKEVPVQYLDVIGVLFCEGLLPLLQEEDCIYREEDLKCTWLKLFRTIASLMKKGYDVTDVPKTILDDAR